MTYIEKKVGDECPTCGENYIEGKKGAYCLKCYKDWANKNKPQGTQTSYNAPRQQSNTDIPLDQFVTLTTYNKTLDAQRSAFKMMDDRIKKLESLLANELGMIDELEIPIV